MSASQETLEHPLVTHDAKKHHKYQYVVICGRCGIQPLEYKDYISQMRRADYGWECPNCGESAEWDDDSLTTNPPDCPYCAMESANNQGLLDALKGVVRVADRQTDEFEAARAIIAKIEGGP